MKPSEDDLLLLSVRLGPTLLTDNLEAYRNGQGVLLPLGEVCRLLEVAIQPSPVSGTAQGVFGRAERTFRLDAVHRSAALAGANLPFDPAFVQVQRGDIYVDVRALNAWFDLGITVDERASEVVVAPKEPLPIQMRLERENRAAQLKSSFRNGYRDPGFPRVANPYALFSVPAIDHSLSLSLAPASAGGGTAIRYSASFANDMAGQGMSGYLNVQPGSTSTLRLAFERRDESGGLFGPLHVRGAEFGGIQSLAVPLVTTAHDTTGLFISNAELSGSGSMEPASLSGALPTGWDVELYQGDALVDYRKADGSGRYEFNNVPLSIGVNRFRLVFNGPLGEHREEIRTRSVSDTLVPRREFHYGVFLGGSSSEPEWTAQGEMGVTRDITAFTDLTQASLADGSHLYSTLGMRGYLRGALVSARLIRDAASGQASEIGGQWAWGRTHINLDQITVAGLSSNVVGRYRDPIRSATRFQLGNVSLPGWSKLLPADLQISREETTLGSQRWEARGRLSYQHRGLGITHWASWQSSTEGGDQRTGELLLSDWHNGRFVQGRLSYRWMGSPKIEAFSLQTGRVLPDLRVLTFGVYESPLDRNIGLTTTLTRNAGTYSYGFSLDLSTKHGASLGLNIAFGTVRNPASGQWVSSAFSETSRAAVLVRAFLDANGNGRFDKGEAPVAGMGVFVNDSPFANLSGADGTLLVDNLPAFRPADVRVSEATLDNPLLASKTPGFRLTPRPGNVQTVDFPIIATGEISGTVYQNVEGSLQPFGGVSVEIVDASNRVVGNARTAYDGFFTLSRVPVGAYTVQVKLDSRTAFKKIVVPPAGAFLDGIDLTVVAGKP